MVSIDDFKKIEVTLGKILSVEKVPDTDKLLRLEVDFGLQRSSQSTEDAQDHTVPQGNVESDSVAPEETAAEADTEHSADAEARDIRQVISGIALYLEDPQVLVGKTVPFVTNLEPRTIRGLKSQAMIFAASTEDGLFSVLEPTLAAIPAGTRLN